MLASKIKKEIKEDIREKFISLKIDIATRMDRAILGINIQLIKNGNLTLRTIAMNELTHRYTTEYIKNTVAEVLEQWFSTFSVLWPIFQPKLRVTSQPTLVKKIEFLSQNHSVL